MAKTETVLLLLVDISVADVIVECPMHEAVEGALVECTYDGRDIIGTVTREVAVHKHSVEYQFMAAAGVIYQAKNIWNHSWTAANDENQ